MTKPSDVLRKPGLRLTPEADKALGELLTLMRKRFAPAVVSENTAINMAIFEALHTERERHTKGKGG